MSMEAKPRATYAAAMAEVPPMQAGWLGMAQTLLGPDSTVSNRVKELAGRSVAARYANRLTPGLVPGAIDAKTPQEMLAAELGLQAGRNHVAIPDEFFDRLSQVFTEAELVELWLWVGYMAGGNRFGVALDLAPATLTSLLP